jgi:hypothetical protein
MLIFKPRVVAELNWNLTSQSILGLARVIRIAAVNKPAGAKFGFPNKCP